MPLYAKCTSCSYLNDRYINVPTPLAAIIATLEEEHHRKSPDCPVRASEFLVANPDPTNHREHPQKRIPRLIHVKRRQGG